jgi:HSP20 family protein
MEDKKMADTVPVRKLSSIHNEMKEIQDRIMRRAFEIFKTSGSTLGRDLENWTEAERELVWKPAFELSESDGRFHLEAAISGVDPKHIDIEVTPEDIILKAETHHQHRATKGVVHYCEFASGSMFRAIHLPKKINPDKVKAEFKDGLLRLTAEIAETRTKKSKPEAA